MIAFTTTTQSVQLERVVACADGLAYRAGDGSYGETVDVTVAQLVSGTFTDGQGKTWKITAAHYLSGVGLTCDNPAHEFFYGYDVDESGAQGPNALYPLIGIAVPII